MLTNTFHKDPVNPFNLFFPAISWYLSANINADTVISVIS